MRARNAKLTPKEISELEQKLGKKLEYASVT